jgi:hypothetical protein
MGAGKTTVLAEASDILASLKIPHAAIDLDALGLAYLPVGSASDAVMYRNLQSVCENYALLGIQRILLARAIESRAELDLCRSSVSAATTLVCRLNASLETMQHRVTTRETGPLQKQFVARVSALNSILDRVHLEDFTVTNENRSGHEIAREVLVKAQCIDA